MASKIPLSSAKSRTEKKNADQTTADNLSPGTIDTMTEIMTKSKKTTPTGQTLLSYGVQPYVLNPEDEMYMSEAQLSHFRNILNIWKKALLQGGDDTIHDLKESAEIPADISDQATQEETFALKLRTRDRESKLLKKIEESIELIDSKEYGYCNECGEEIGIRRLEARPTATLCIDCKTLDEVRERQRG
jgi:DnaK suppressor protein